MAKMIDSGRQLIEREPGDVCARKCPGTLRVIPGDHMECVQCHFTYSRRYRVADDTMHPKPPGAYLPDEIILAYIEAVHARDLAAAMPNPTQREEINDPDWFAKLSHALREQWIEDARNVLLPIWPLVADFFGSAASYRDGIRQLNAARAVQELAIPALKHCEDAYGFDDQARLNLEAVIKEGDA